jgi:hypothetical protein
MHLVCGDHLDSSEMRGNASAVLAHCLGGVGRAQPAIERCVGLLRNAALAREEAMRDSGQRGESGGGDRLQHGCRF